MDGSPTPPTPPATLPSRTPYRDGKALAEIIPPDRRRQRTIALVLGSMSAGVGLWLVGGWILDSANESKPTVTVVQTDPGYLGGRIVPSVLHGPGRDQAMPPKGRSVVHVWLQACSDCMPAFEAIRDLEKNGGLGVRVPVVNVAYGEADLAWAARYNVNTNLVFDPGGASVVKPLGIGSFTTLVIDADGAILLRDRPDRPGYRDRVRAAVGAQNLEPETLPEQDPLAAPGFDAASVERVVDMHRQEVKRQCWDPLGETHEVTSASVRVQITVGTDGHVASSTATGDQASDKRIALCIERQVKTWVFPAPTSPSTINIPFKFVRQ